MQKKNGGIRFIKTVTQPQDIFERLKPNARNCPVFESIGAHEYWTLTLCPKKQFLIYQNAARTDVT